jgi:hypothetical protein
VGRISESSVISAPLVARLRQLAAQRRQAGERALQRRLLLQDIGARSAPGIEPLLRDVELRLLRARDLLGCRDLCAQRRLTDRLGHDVRGETEIAGFQSEALVLRLGRQRLDLAAHAAERVEGVGNAHRGRVQRVERRPQRRDAILGTARFRALRLVGSGDARKEAAALGRGGLVGIAQGGLRRRERRIVRQGALDQGVEVG